jgi:hypothetical protein
VSVVAAGPATAAGPAVVDRPPDPVVRVAGRPVGILSGLRCPGAAAMIGEILDLDALLVAEADPVGTALHDVIATLPPGDPARPLLVGLRRAVHAARPPRPREWDDATATLLPPGVAASTRAWVDAVRTRQRLVGALPAVLAAETATALDAVLAAADEPGFRRALARSSPTLDGELQRWLTDGRRPRARAVVRLARYLARAATKTSPYATFTVSGLGRWSRDDPDGPALPAPAVGPPTTVLELDHLLVTAVRRAVLARGGPVADPPLRIGAGAALTADEVVAIGPPPGEPVAAVGLTPAVATCLDTLGRPDGAERPRSVVVAALVDAGAEPAAAGRFVDRLVELGVLHTGGPRPDDPSLLSGLPPRPSGPDLPDPAGLPGLPGLPGLLDLLDLRALEAELRRDLPADDVAAHRTRLHAVAHQAAAVADAVGLTGAARLARQRPGAVSHEHAVASGPPAVLALHAWRPVLDDLEVVRRWLAVHDPTLPLRLVLGDWVAARIGPGATLPFVALHHAIRRELAAGPPDDLGGELARRLDLAGAVAADELEHAPVARLRELAALRLAATTPPAHGAASAVTAAVPPWLTDPGSVACYVQPLVTDGRPAVVLDTVTVGYGRGRTRLRHLMGCATPLRPHHCLPEPVELSGTFGTALNLRAPATRYEMEYPGTTGTRPPAERIRFGALLARHDPRTGLVGLVDPARDLPVRLVHLGLMVDQLLPPAARLAVRIGGFTAMPPGWSEPAPPRPLPGEVLSTPRVEVGTVTLRRARWWVGEGAMPGRVPGEDDATLLLRVARWRHRHGIPARGFVRAGAAGSATGAVFDKSRKPLYVDWESWPLVATVERLLRGPTGSTGSAGTVVIEEAHPDPGAAPAGHRVTELIVEVSGCGCDV